MPIYSLAGAPKLVLFFDIHEHKTQQNHTIPQACIASAALRSRPGSTTSVGKATSLGTVELSVSLSQNQSDLFYCFLKGNIPALAISFFVPVLQRKQKVRVGAVTVFNMNKTDWGCRDLWSKRSTGNVPFDTFTLKWIQSQDCCYLQAWDHNQIASLELSLPICKVRGITMNSTEIGTWLG